MERTNENVELVSGDNQEEIQQLNAIIDREKSACSQWKIQVQTISLTLLCIVINLIRGTPKFDSIIGMDTCGITSWSILAIFILFCLVVTWFNVREVRAEQILKLKYNVGVSKSEPKLTDKNLAIILSMGFLSSFIGQIFGFGGAFLFNPFQVFMGVNPIVAASTS